MHIFLENTFLNLFPTPPIKNFLAHSGDELHAQSVVKTKSLVGSELTSLPNQAFYQGEDVDQDKFPQHQIFVGKA